METIKGQGGDVVAQMPIDTLIRQGQSQRDRRLLEVMTALHGLLPDKEGDHLPSFILADGTECRIVKFSAPYERDGRLRYGFDVRLDRGPIDHLEFCVKCSGWGGGV